jgi:lipid II:glycine glycyltransferase (peptidoglycan interpeptide bridge formation enzyme)
MQDLAPSPPIAGTRWARWDQFLERTPAAGFMQSSWWADFRSTTGYENFGAILSSHDHLLGGAVVHRFCPDDARCFYYLPDGPVLPTATSDCALILDALLTSIDDRRRHDDRTVTHLRVEPRWTALPDCVAALGLIPAIRDGYSEPRRTRCIDLRPAEIAVLGQMHPKGRYNIGLARRHGVTVVEDRTPQGLDDFLALYGATTDRQQIATKPVDYFATLLALLTAHDRGTLYFAEYGGRRIATALVVYFGHRATYFFGGSLAEERQVMAPYLLHFEIMRHARRRGMEWYDLWGIAPDGAPDHPWARISEFKSRFGGEVVELVPTLDLVLDADGYAEYCRGVDVRERP